MKNTRRQKLYTAIKTKAPVPKTQASTVCNEAHSAVLELRLSIGHTTKSYSSINTEIVYIVVDGFLVHLSHSKTKPKYRLGSDFCENWSINAVVIQTLQVPVSKEKTNSDCKNLFVRNKSFLFHMDKSSSALIAPSPKSTAGHQDEVMDYSSKRSSLTSTEGKKPQTLSI